MIALRRQQYFLYNLGFLICSYDRNFINVPPRCSTNGTWLSPFLASLPSALRAGQSLRRYVDSDMFYIHLLNVGLLFFVPSLEAVLTDMRSLANMQPLLYFTSCIGIVSVPALVRGQIRL